MERTTIYLLPLGEAVPEEELALSQQAISAYFDHPCTVLAPAPLPETAWHGKRNQYNAEVILTHLIEMLPDDAMSLIAVADSDMFAKLSNFVFGFASLTSRVAVHSIARYRNEFHDLPPDTAAFRQRIIKVMAHELGHTFTLRHCANRNCVMVYSSTLSDLDYSGIHFCERCAEKLAASIGTPYHKRRKDVAALIKQIEAGEPLAAALG